MLTNLWRTEAFKRFPELHERFEGLDTPYQLWFELVSLFDQAYRPPKNEELIERIYAYSEWCVTQPEGQAAEDDLGTCVCGCFYEHIPTNLAAMEDMPRWFSRADVLAMKPIFAYDVGEAGFQRILEVYDRQRKALKKASKR